MDLNPAGFWHSVALGVSGNMQVGFGYNSTTAQDGYALVWFGTTESVIDLQSFLPPNYGSSAAEGIDQSGNIVGYAQYLSTGATHAILWTVIPEPGTPVLFALGIGALFLRRKRTR